MPGTLPPSGWSAVKAWGQIYPEAGASASINADAQIQIQDLTTYLLLNTGQWVEVQNQSTDPVAGAEYVATFANNASIPWTASTSNGVVTANAPANGFVDHFYLNCSGLSRQGPSMASLWKRKCAPPTRALN